MASVKVLTDFSKLRDGDLQVRALSIVLQMTDNANYPSPMPTLDEVNAAAIAFGDACAKTGSDREKTFIKKTKRQALESLLQALAWYVQCHCQNNMGILLSSGFSSRKTRTPVGTLDKPMYFKVEDGPNPGTIKLSIAKLAGAASYIFQYAAAPVDESTQWTTSTGTARTCTIEGLMGGQRYAFRVAGVGADRRKVYSDVIYRYSQ